MMARLPPEAAELAGHAVPLERVGAADGAMGEGVAVYDKVYYSIRLELSVSPLAAAGVQWVLDSAASSSLLTPAAARLLDARATGVTATADTASAVGASGLTQVDLGEARLPGGLECGRLAPVVMDLPVAGPCGLLGLDFLTRHDVDLRIRPVAPCAIFHPAGSTTRGEGCDAEGLACLSCARLPSGLLTTRVRLCPAGSGGAAGGGGTVAAIVDLGSPLTLVNWAAARSVGLSEGDARVRTTNDVIAGASGEPVRIAEARLTLELDDGTLREDVVVNIADLPIFSAVGLPRAAAVLGLDSLAPSAEAEAGSRLVLATSEAKLWVERAGQ